MEGVDEARERDEETEETRKKQQVLAYYTPR